MRQQHRPRTAPYRERPPITTGLALALLVLSGCGPARPPKLEPVSPAGGAPGGPVPGFNLPDGGAAGGLGSPTAVPSVNPWGGQFVDPALPSEAPRSFSGPGKETATGGPQVVYPLPWSLHPINVLDITVQWRRADTAQTLFRLRFQNDRGTYELFVPCALDDCSYPVPPESWRHIAGLNRDRDVQLTVTGAGVAGGLDRVSTPINIHFSPYRVEGGLYYWSTSLQGTYRLNLGEKKALPFITPGQGGCYGCHAVSRNGKRIAWTDMSPPARGVGFQARTLRAAPTDMPNNRLGGADPSTTMTLSPDGSKVLVSDGTGDLVLRDAASGAMIAQVPPAMFGGKAGFFPEWSPDGKNIAVTLGPRDANFSLGFNLPDAEIGILPYNDGRFGPVAVLVRKDKDIHFYPSWSPDGKWIVFCSAPVGTAARTYDNPMSRLRLVGANGGLIYDLGQATQGMGTTASWPKFSPFSQLDGQLLFIGFSSRIDYGFLKRDPNIPQLWLAAVDLRKLSTNDPSWAPIWLPFQEVDQNNHLPFWTESLGCTQDTECGEGAVCRDSGCVPRVVID
jgi:hypothetical protein